MRDINAEKSAGHASKCVKQEPWWRVGRIKYDSKPAPDYTRQFKDMVCDKYVGDLMKIWGTALMQHNFDLWGIKQQEMLAQSDFHRAIVKWHSQRCAQHASIFLPKVRQTVYMPKEFIIHVESALKVRKPEKLMHLHERTDPNFTH